MQKLDDLQRAKSALSQDALTKELQRTKELVSDPEFPATGSESATRHLHPGSVRNTNPPYVRTTLPRNPRIRKSDPFRSTQGVSNAPHVQMT